MDFSTPKEVSYRNNPIPVTVAQQQAQQATIRVLLQWGGVDVRAKDVDGTTALHYLAGTLNMSDTDISRRAVESQEGQPSLVSHSFCYIHSIVQETCTLSFGLGVRVCAGESR